MARTTDSLVMAIIDVDSGDVLDPFISAANNLVTQCCTGSAMDPAYSAQVLQEIETWLAAHFYCMYNPRAEMEKAGDVAARYETKIRTGLFLSKYGQMAMALDWQGGLAALNDQLEKGGRANIGATWLGTDYATEGYD
jgi:hypothetical protein